jgi:hypothetical protein
MMTAFNRALPALATPASVLPIRQRCPQRISITLNWAAYQRLVDRSGYEGRSMSNLAAHLIELGCQFSEGSRGAGLGR